MPAAPAITDAQRQEFADFGILRLPGAVPPESASAMADHVWTMLEATGTRRQDPTTWPHGGAKVPGAARLLRQSAFRLVSCPLVAAGLDELFGRDAWNDDPRSKERPFVNFCDCQTWSLPIGGWHLDRPPGGSVDGIAAVTVFAFLNRVEHGGGGTSVIAGGHKLVGDLIASNPTKSWRSRDLRKRLVQSEPLLKSLWSGTEAIARLEGHSTNGHPLKAFDLTGEPGDVVILHPWLFHAGSTNARVVPRMMLIQFIGKKK